jgi:hypothetical protein
MTVQNTNIANKIGYVWSYILADEEHLKIDGKEYFKPCNCYRCSECGFVHNDCGKAVRHGRNYIKQWNTTDKFLKQKGAPFVDQHIVW